MNCTWKDIIRIIILVVILNILQDADLRQCLGFSYQISSSKEDSKTVEEDSQHQRNNPYIFQK